MREMVAGEGAYISYFKNGSGLDLPVSVAPYEVSLVSSPDSIKIGRRYKIHPVSSDQIRLESDLGTAAVPLNRRFRVAGIGTLVVQKTDGFHLTDVSGDFGFSIAPLRNTVSALQGRMNIAATNKNVSTIDLNFVDPSPKRGEQLLAAFIQKYIDRNLWEKNLIADSTLAFINSRLNSVTVDLARIEDRISRYKQNEKMADISTQSQILLQHTAEYAKSLGESEAMLAAIDGTLAYLRDERNVRVIPTSVSVQDISLNTLLDKYNTLVLQREQLLLANTPENPLVKNVDLRIRGLRQDMIASLQGRRNQIEAGHRKQQELAKQMSAQIHEIPLIERGYIDLARLQQIKQAQYIFLQEKWEETAIGRRANTPNARLIDSPQADTSPFSPNVNRIYLIGLLIGLALPAVALYLTEVLNFRIRDLEDVAQRSSLPVLGVLSHSPHKEEIVVSPKARTAIAEQFRALRTNLDFALRGGKTIMLTSSMSGEGKSFVGLNLALTLALINKKVLLMEFDMRRPSLAAKMGLASSTVGLSSYAIRPELRMDDIVIPSGLHELIDYIPAGIVPPNPSELIQSERIAQLLEQAKQRYDYVLLDTPPIGLVTDAQLLTSYVDATLYLIRQGHTYKEQVNIPNEMARAKKLTGVQLILNDVKATKGSYYARYGYGYATVYGEDPAGVKNSWFSRFKKR